MAGSTCEPPDDGLLGILIVDACDADSNEQQYTVEFVFFEDTTAGAVLGDLEETLRSMGLQLAAPRDQCAIAFRDPFSANSDCANEAFTQNGTGNDLKDGGGDGIVVLSDNECIFQVPIVRMSYDRVSGTRTGEIPTFFLVRMLELAVTPTAGACRGIRDNGSVVSNYDCTVQNDETFLCHCNDPGSQAALPCVSTNDKNGGVNAVEGVGGKNMESYDDFLARVYCMGKDEEKRILAARHQRELRQEERSHWSSKLASPPSRKAWMEALVAEAAAYDRLTAEVANVASRELVRKAEIRDALEGEVAELQERVDTMKVYIAQRSVLEERIEQLTRLHEEQKEKEHQLLLELERLTRNQSRESVRDHHLSAESRSFHSTTLLGVSKESMECCPLSTSRAASSAHTSRSAALQSPVRQSPTESPRLATTATRALDSVNSLARTAPHSNKGVTGSFDRTVPAGNDGAALPVHNNYSGVPIEHQSVDIDRLRQLAAELTNHLKDRDRDPVTRLRLMSEIRMLRQRAEFYEAHKQQRCRQNQTIGDAYSQC